MTGSVRQEPARPSGPARAHPSGGAPGAGPSSGLRLVLLAAPLLAGLSPVFLQSYAFTDDWALLDELATGARSHQLVIMGGRPLLAAAQQLAFPLAGTIANLAWLRLLAVVGLVALAWVLHRRLEQGGWSPYQAIAVAVAAAVMPGTVLFTAWAVCFTFPWVLALSGVAFAVGERARASTTTSGRIGRLALATLLLTACFLVYQPAAAAYWVFFAVAFLAPGTVARARLALHALLVFGASASLGLVAMLLGRRLFPGLPSGRTALLSDPLGKLRWFVEAPLVEAWNLVSIHGSARVAVAVGLLSAAGLLLASRRAGLHPLLALGAAAALLLAAYSPNLAVAENFASFRSEVALSLMAAVLAATGLRGLAGLAPPLERALTPALALIAGAFLLTAAGNQQDYVVRPNTVELSWLRAALAAPSAEVVVVPRGSATVAPGTVHDEYGFPTVTCSWAVPLEIAVIQRERGQPAPRVVFLDGSDPAYRIGPGVTVVETGWLTAMRPPRRP